MLKKLFMRKLFNRGKHKNEKSIVVNQLIRVKRNSWHSSQSALCIKSIIDFDEIFVSFGQISFWWEREKKFTPINFPEGRKNWKMAPFWPPLHKSKLIFHANEVDIQNFYQFKIQANCNDHKKFLKDILIKSSSKLSLKIYFFAIFWVRTWFLRSMGAVAQNWLIPQKFHKNQNCRVSRSKIIMCLWSVALKARTAANWLRTFFTGRTVNQSS